MDMSTPQPLQPCPFPTQSTTPSHPRQNLLCRPTRQATRLNKAQQQAAASGHFQTRCTRGRRHALGHSAAHDRTCGVLGWHPSHSAPAPNPTPRWLLRLQKDPPLHANDACSALRQHAERSRGQQPSCGDVHISPEPTAGRCTLSRMPANTCPSYDARVSLKLNIRPLSVDRAAQVRTRVGTHGPTHARHYIPQPASPTPCSGSA